MTKESIDEKAFEKAWDTLMQCDAVGKAALRQTISAYLAALPQPSADRIERVALAIYSRFYIDGETFKNAPLDETLGGGWLKSDFIAAAEHAIAAMPPVEVGIKEALEKCKIYLSADAYAGDAHAAYLKSGGLQRLPTLVLVMKAIAAMEGKP